MFSTISTVCIPSPEVTFITSSVRFIGWVSVYATSHVDVYWGFSVLTHVSHSLVSGVLKSAKNKNVMPL